MNILWNTEEKRKSSLKDKSATKNGWLMFHGISTLVGFLMSNPVYIKFVNE